MEKFCIFCGEKPESKTREHIIPRWLIESTGELNRTAFFGYSRDLDKEPEKRLYSFNQFTFPACDSCNNNFSSLEADAKPILHNILRDTPIKAYQLSLFLDWLDKVRIGLWLAMHQLDKNYADVEPKFHIQRRIGQSDRLLIIQKSDYQSQRLNFSGVEALTFALTPSAFTLIINNYYFTNISTGYLFAARIGFPFPKILSVSPDADRIDCEFSTGNERIMRPFLRKAIREKGTRFYQPMYGNLLVSAGIESYYQSSKYVQEHSMVLDKGIGNIFEELADSVKEHDHDDSINLTPAITYPDHELMKQSSIEILEWQNWLTTLIPSLEKLSPDQRQEIKSKFRTAVRINNKWIEHYKKLPIESWI